MSRGLGEHQREIIAILYGIFLNHKPGTVILVPELARRTGRSKRNTRRAVESLRRRGVVEVIQGTELSRGRGNGVRWASHAARSSPVAAVTSAQ